MIKWFQGWLQARRERKLVQALIEMALNDLERGSRCSICRDQAADCICDCGPDCD